MRYSVLIPPQHCFCQVSSQALKHWAQQRHQLGRSTPELMDETKDLSQQELITLVALLEADQHMLLEVMSQVSLPYTHIIQCRDHTRALLELPPASVDP